MPLPYKLATSPAFHSLVGAHSFILGQAAWQYRPSFLRHSPPARSISTSPNWREQNIQEHRDLQSSSSSGSPSRASSSASSEAKSSSEKSSSDSASIRERKTAELSDRSAENAEAQPRPSWIDSPTADSTARDSANQTLPPGWEDDTNYNITNFSELPHRFFGYNQHIKVNEDFKEALRQVLWQFRAPIRYAFAYGSGVFGQKSSSGSSSAALSPHPNPPKAVEEWQKGGAKCIDFIFGVSHTQHWHSLNLVQHPQHYSALRYLPNSSAAVAWMQDHWGAGVYFNPYITVNGVMIKYGVVNLDTLARDLSEWDTLYLAGRLQKPVKILRDDPRIRLSNQVNLVSALRTALLMLPEQFTERQLYERIAGLSYMGDPRMNRFVASENPAKVANIVGAQLPGFRQLYVPLIENLPNVEFTDTRTPKEHAWEKEDAIRHTGTNSDLRDVLGGDDGLTLSQDFDPVRRGNMVRRLPQAFRRKLYYQYKKQFGIRGSAFDNILENSQDEDASEGFKRHEGGEFEQRIAQQDDLAEVMAKCVRSTVAWPATMQTVKGVFTSGVGRAWTYFQEKRSKGVQKASAEAKTEKIEDEGLDSSKNKTN